MRAAYASRSWVRMSQAVPKIVQQLISRISLHASMVALRGLETSAPHTIRSGFMLSCMPAMCWCVAQDGSSRAPATKEDHGCLNMT